MRRGISSRAAEFAHCRGILTLPQYFNISAEFEKRLVISTIIGVIVITVISLDFLSFTFSYVRSLRLFSWNT